MGRKRRRLQALGIAAVLLSLALTASAPAGGKRTRDRVALQAVQQRLDPGIERRIDALLRRMTLEEKLNQLTLLSDGQMKDLEKHPEEARKPVGSVFSETDPVLINKYQRHAVKKSRLGIPILFAFDTIHGFRTIFPIPLGAASSFDPEVARADHRIGAFESAAVGLKQIYSPMVDLSHEPRWGRISEAAGEDPYLNSVMAAARVKGAQGHDYSAPDKVVTSVKHFAAYGEPDAGRDYNTTDMSLQRLWNFYLPPFKAAIDAGSDTLMCSFNAINGVPGCANSYTETNILKRRWGFDGFVESDYTAVAELRACPGENPAGGPCGHGVAEDGMEAARLALNAGTDTEMVSTNYRDFGRQLVASGQVSMRRIDDAVRRILRVKFRAGLFKNPYVDVDKAPGKQLLPQNRAAARQAAGRSMVLLKNEGVLPLDPAKSTAIIGPLGDSKHDMLGPWWGRGDEKDAVSLFEGMRAQNPNTTFTPGCTLSNKELYDPANECASDTGFPAAIAAAEGAQQVVLALGETREMSGEAESRSTLDLPGMQEELIKAIKATGKPFAVVLFNGRPLTLEEVYADSPAILEAWFPGVEAGNAVADVVYGKVNPGGKLPVSFPRNVGQVPIFYNHKPTGRPCNIGSKYNSRHRDILSCGPLFEFGYGLSYTTFSISAPSLSAATMDARRGSVTVSAAVTNTGSLRAGDEVAQLYIHDRVASISQPVRRLRGFERVTLQPGQTKTVRWTLDRDDVGFYDNRGRFVVENGRIDVYVGNSSSQSDNRRSFTVTGGRSAEAAKRGGRR